MGLVWTMQCSHVECPSPHGVHPKHIVGIDHAHIYERILRALISPKWAQKHDSTINVDLLNAQYLVSTAGYHGLETSITTADVVDNNLYCMKMVEMAQRW